MSNCLYCKVSINLCLLLLMLHFWFSRPLLNFFPTLWLCYLGSLFLRDSVKSLNSLYNTSHLLAITKPDFPPRKWILLGGGYLLILSTLPMWSILVMSMARSLTIQWALHTHGFRIHGFNKLWVENKNTMLLLNELCS